MRTRPLSGAATLLLLVACGSGSQPYARGLSVASTTPPSSLLRLPAAGGAAELFHLPRLTTWEWKTAVPLPPLRRAIGVDLDQGMVYGLSARNELVALDLLTARPRPQMAAGVRDVMIGPDGTLFAVDDSLRIVQYVRRNPNRLSNKLPVRPRDLFGSRNGGLLAVSTGATGSLSVFRGDDAPTRSLLPNGDAAATFWGDLLAIAADTAVVLVDPEDADHPVALPVEGHARAVLFSPSGHRLYVARREGPLLVYNRFSREKVGEIDLPGAAGAMRADPFGRWLLVHPTGADSLWLVDLARNKYVGGFAADWATDLPTVTNRQVLLLKSGADVVAYDLTAEDLPETGRIKDGAADFWLALAWSPETGTASVVAPVDSTAPVDTAEAPAVSQVYLQVSSSQNRDWSAELARQLAQQGLPATVLEPRPGEEGFRVVLGPYPSREIAESTGRQLGRPFFIYQPDR